MSTWENIYFCNRDSLWKQKLIGPIKENNSLTCEPPSIGIFFINKHYNIRLLVLSFVISFLIFLVTLSSGKGTRNVNVNFIYFIVLRVVQVLSTVLHQWLKSIPFLNFSRVHLRSKLGIICGRGSFAVHFGDYLRSGDHLRYRTRIETLYLCKILIFLLKLKKNSWPF